MTSRAIPLGRSRASHGDDALVSVCHSLTSRDISESRSVQSQSRTRIPIRPNHLELCASLPDALAAAGQARAIARLWGAQDYHTTAIYIYTYITYAISDIDPRDGGAIADAAVRRLRTGNYRRN